MEEKDDDRDTGRFGRNVALGGGRWGRVGELCSIRLWAVTAVTPVPPWPSMLVLVRYATLRGAAMQDVFGMACSVFRMYSRGARRVGISGTDRAQCAVCSQARHRHRHRQAQNARMVSSPLVGTARSGARMEAFNGRISPATLGAALSSRSGFAWLPWLQWLQWLQWLVEIRRPISALQGPHGAEFGG